MALDREQRREERQSLVAIAAADVTTSALRTTFLPQSMGEAMQFAAMMANSNFVPAHLRGKDGDCMAVLMIASRWGMDPFAVANKTYFTKEGAPPAFEAQLVNAVVNGSNALSGRLRVWWEGEGEKLRCTVSGYLRADPNEEKIRTQAISRITTRNSPLWKSDPEQQLAYYTTRAWAKLYAPEVLLGVFTPDDIDVDPERARNVTPPMPRRGAMPELSTYDAGTGEVYGEGRAVEQRGEQHLDGHGREVDPQEAKANEIIERAGKVELMGDLMSLVGEAEQHIAAMSDPDMVAACRKALSAAEARLKKGGK
jgi:hypothetical protein